MSKSLEPTDAKTSMETAHLLESYRQMYIMIRAKHMLSKRGSDENKALMEFMTEHLLQETWTDREQVEEKIKKGMELLMQILGDSLKPPATAETTTTTTEIPVKAPLSQTKKSPVQSGEQKPLKPEALKGVNQLQAKVGGRRVNSSQCPYPKKQVLVGTSMQRATP